MYKQSDGSWVTEGQWQGAVAARARGNETVRQRQILDRGHISDN